MTAEYWLADSEARVLGPISLEVVTTLHARGKLLDVRAVSSDGRTFVPLREMPELLAILTAPVTEDATARAQAQTTRQLRDWLLATQGLPTHEVFKVPPTSSRDAYRAAFFALVHRYVPSRLPPDTTPELRLACEDAFLTLAERMVEVERNARGPRASSPSGAGIPLASAPQPFAVLTSPAPEPRSSPPLAATAPAKLARRDGTLHVVLELRRGDARPFTQDLEHHWQNDCLFVPTIERVVPGTPTDVVIAFEGHVTQLHAAGRALAARHGGFTTQLLHLGEAERGLIRTWVARAQIRL